MIRNRRGSVLILCFWALIVLGLLGLGISRRVDAQLRLVRYQSRKAQTRYAAFAGLAYVLEQVRQDEANEQTRDRDTLYDCGLALAEDQTPREILGDRQVGDAVFRVRRIPVAGEETQELFGLNDETARLNVNALTESNYNILAELLEELEVPEQQAEMIAASVIDWKDENHITVAEDLGAEQSYYAQLPVPYDCKNRYLENVEELLLVRGMTPEIFERLRPYITIYPLWGSLRVNFSTASEPVLLALARWTTGARTGANDMDAASFVRKVMDFREGADGIEGTRDDEVVTLGQQGLALNGPETAIAAALSLFHSPRSFFIRARVESEIPGSHVKSFLDAVIQTQGLAVVALDFK